MLEHIVQMGPMLILGRAGGRLDRRGRHPSGGLRSTSDMALALVGSAVAGLTVWLGTSGGAGMATMFLIGCGGAVLLIAAQRSMWRGPGLGA
jgi:hypothetical protein